MREPGRVNAVTDSGLTIPCAVIFQEIDRDGNRCYALKAESVAWERLKIKRVEVRGWPAGVAFTFWLEGLSPAESRQWLSGIDMVELPYDRR